MSCFLCTDAISKFRGNTPKIGSRHKRNEVGGKCTLKLECRIIGVEAVCGPVDTIFFYTTDDLQQGGANVMIEVQRRALVDLDRLLAERGLYLPRHVVLQFDNCSENKNQFMLGYASLLVEKHHVDKINLCFLVVGHTHCSIDQYFSALATFIFRCGFIPTPLALHQLLRCAHKSKLPAVVEALTVRLTKQPFFGFFTLSIVEPRFSFYLFIAH